MSSAALFVIGTLISILAGGGVAGLVLAAIADGRENDRIQAELAHAEPAG